MKNFNNNKRLLLNRKFNRKQKWGKSKYQKKNK